MARKATLCTVCPKGLLLVFVKFYWYTFIYKPVYTCFIIKMAELRVLPETRLAPKPKILASDSSQKRALSTFYQDGSGVAAWRKHSQGKVCEV